MTVNALLAGAVAADIPDELVAGHYGDPLREQRQLAGAAGLVDRSNRGVLTVTGADRLSWLHSLTSQRLDKLAPMTGAEALVLSARGHVEHHLVVVDDGETAWIDVEPAAAAALFGYLDSMRFMLKVEVADVSEQWAVLTLAGPEAAGVLTRAFGVEPPDGEYAAVPLPEGGLVRSTTSLGEDIAAFDLLVPRDRLATVVGVLIDAGATPAGMAAFEALRVAAGRPRMGRETDHKTLPHEVGWIGTAVTLGKGCYRGQETVAHISNLGRPPRRLVRLHLDGTQEELPGRGTPVRSDDKVVGEITTAARHFEQGPIALALVAYKTPDDADVHVGSDDDEPVVASIDSVVTIDEGPRPGAAARAQFRRLR